MLDCPVCAKPVDRETAPTSVYQGITYYLRCQHCKERFDADPGRFLRNGADPDHGGCGEPEVDRAALPWRVPVTRSMR